MSKLYNIKDCMEDLDEVIDILYKQWGKYLRRGKSERAAEYKNAAVNNLEFPQLYVMKDGSEVIGTFTIKEMEFDASGKVPSVWYLVIKEEHRGKGYGRELLQFLSSVCKKYKKVYLLTKHNGLYEKIGFKFVNKMNHNGDVERLYLKDNSLYNSSTKTSERDNAI